MSSYIRCPHCGEDSLDVDTLTCGCAGEKAAEAKTKAHAAAVEAVLAAAGKVEWDVVLLALQHAHVTREHVVKLRAALAALPSA